MIYELADTAKVALLFEGWPETLIRSCLQKVMAKPEGFVIMTPQNEKWADCIEDCFPDAKKVKRYAIKKNTQFDKSYLQSLVKQIPDEYELKEIDGVIYDMCLSDPVTRDFVSSFGSKEKYLAFGRGMVILKSYQKREG
ncbi:MAG: GNAT family N-acetyltransferase [Lachnospiraceae bacterium]|nr:GNAT family N-acetyltransferase [Lachnospiraceae bacterium]